MIMYMWNNNDLRINAYETQTLAMISIVFFSLSHMMHRLFIIPYIRTTYTHTNLCKHNRHEHTRKPISIIKFINGLYTIQNSFIHNYTTWATQHSIHSHKQIHNHTKYKWNGVMLPISLCRWDDELKAGRKQNGANVMESNSDFDCFNRE